MPPRLCLLLALVTTGCQTSPRAGRAVDQEISDGGLDVVVASALVFDPPVIADDAPLELNRADRGPAAVVGYDELIEEVFYIRLDDRQRSDGFDRYERRAVTERVGVRYR